MDVKSSQYKQCKGLQNQFGDSVHPRKVHVQVCIDSWLTVGKKGCRNHFQAFASGKQFFNAVAVLLPFPALCRSKVRLWGLVRFLTRS